MIGITQKYVNNGHCKLMLPFTNSVTENRAKGASHVVTNNGVSIRTLADYSIPNCPNGATKAAYFNGTTAYLSIPYSNDFDRFTQKGLVYQVWVNIEDFTNSPILAAIRNNNTDYIVFYIPNSLFQAFALIELGNVPSNLNNSYKLINVVGTWYHVEVTTEITQSSIYVDSIGVIDTNTWPKRVTPINYELRIGQQLNSNYYKGYMSEFTIINGDYRTKPSTYNPTRNQRYFSIPNRMK